MIDMKRTASIVYTILVIIVLLGTVAFLALETNRVRIARRSDFSVRSRKYVKLLTDSLENARDINAEVALAEALMEKDISLIAIQVYSLDDGLRLSVVKPIVEEYVNHPVTKSELFKGIFGKFQYQIEEYPMHIDDMVGMQASFVGVTLSKAEIRNNFLFLLIVVGGLFIVTLILLFLRPRVISGEDQEYQTLEEKDVLAEEDTLEEEDIDLDVSEDSVHCTTKEDFMERLRFGLDKPDSSNQDLSLLIVSSSDGDIENIKEFYDYDIAHILEEEKIAIVDEDSNLDSSLKMAENFIHKMKINRGNQTFRIGITSQNHRIITPEALFNEAERAFHKTTKLKNIVAFRADLEKYRELTDS